MKILMNKKYNIKTLEDFGFKKSLTFNHCWFYICDNASILFYNLVDNEFTCYSKYNCIDVFTKLLQLSDNKILLIEN